jgi:uncharacterized damage-inducible protein DinB
MADVLTHIADGLRPYQDALVDATRQDPRISAWSVGQQIEHIIQADIGILGFIVCPPPEPVTAGLSFTGRLVLWTGYIPRGRAQAPAATLPAGCEVAALTEGLSAIRARLRELAPSLPQLLRDRTRHAHPILGGLTPRQWLRFIVVHQRHHAAIIADLRRSWPA